MALSANARRIAILQLIRRAGQITRRDIAQSMGLSISLVSRLTSELLHQRLITDDGKSESDGGRPSDLLALNPQAGYVVGLDIGGTRQRAMVADLRGAAVACLSEPTPLSTEREEILTNIERLIDRVIAEAGLDRSAVLGLGLSLRAIVDPASGIVQGWPNTPAWSETWRDFAVRDALAARLPWPYPYILVEDSVRTLGIAEAQYGVGGQNQDFIFVLVGRGIGAAVMLRGTPYLGPNKIAGEIGHIQLTDARIPCHCGNTGCLEILASEPAVLASARQRLRESQVVTTLRRRGPDFTLADIINAAENGDKLAFQILTEAGEYLGGALAIILNLLGPTLVVVGGSLAPSTVFLDAARRMMKLRALTQASQGVSLEQSPLDELAGARGTATLVLNTLFSVDDSPILRLSQQIVPLTRTP